MRLSASLARYAEAEGKRTRRPTGTVIEGLAEEAMRCRLFPGIAFRGTDWARRPWVIGSGLDVWEIAQALEEAGGVDALVTASDVTETHARLAATYAVAYPDEVADQVAENRQTVDELRRRYPTFEVAS
jgi:hypothetical protein